MSAESEPEAGVNSTPMTWQSIAQRDPYLAGSLACRDYEWWEEATAESEADSVLLHGEARDAFLRGWHDEIAEQEAERQALKWAEREAMADDYDKGDPAAR